MSSTTITRGNSHETFYIQPTLNNASNTLAANTTTKVTYTIGGFQTTDIVNCLGVTGDQTAGVIVTECDVSAANTLVVQFANITADATKVPASGVYTFEVVRLEGPAPVNAV